MKKLKKRNIKYFKVESLRNLSVKDIYLHVQKLYAHITKQKRRIKKLQLKIKKLEFLSKLDAHIVKTQQEELKEENKQQKQPVQKTEQRDDKVTDFVNEIKNQAMMNAFEQAGFIYEPTSGLYWDSKTGYYYNPHTDLYYDGNKGSWHRLNPITNEFLQIHSDTEAAKAVKKSEYDEEEAIKKILEDSRQPLKCQEKLSFYDDKKGKKSHYSSSDDDSDDSRKHSRRYKSRSRSRSRSRDRKSRKKDRRSRSNSKTREDGELDSTSSTDTDQRMENEFRQRKRKKKKKGNEYEEIAKKYPPSLRLIVSESQVSSIPVGSLFVVTFKGGTLGREGNHEVLLTAENVSKEHLRFTYNNKRKVYQFVDTSRNGTLLNGKETSLLRKEACEPRNLHHGDILEIAHIKLLAHIHEGLQTCDECEPYNYAQKPQEQPVKSVEEFVPSLSHKEQLKLLQKRYGLESEKYQEKQPGTKNKNYEDRASQRRQKVGSSHDHEKTVAASMDKSISSENKGFKLLSKMGWSEGSSLGKSDSGIKEPVQVKVQQGTSGLGNEMSSISSLERPTNKKKQQIWTKTQERYNNLKDDDDDD